MGSILAPVHIVFHDPGMEPVKCEICDTVLPLKQMKSMKWVYAMPGLADSGSGFPAFQCHDDQHFGCTHEHALLAMLVCVVEHMDECGDYAEKGQEWQHPILTTLKAKLTEDLAHLVKEEEQWTNQSVIKPLSVTKQMHLAQNQEQPMKPSLQQPSELPSP